MHDQSCPHGQSFGACLDSRPTPACPPCSGACGQGRDYPPGQCRNPVSLWATIPAAAPWLILAAAAVAAVLNQFFL